MTNIFSSTIEPQKAYEAAYQAVCNGDTRRIEEMVTAAPFLITNEELREDGPDPLLNQAILDGMRGLAGLRRRSWTWGRM